MAFLENAEGVANLHAERRGLGTPTSRADVAQGTQPALHTQRHAVSQGTLHAGQTQRHTVSHMLWQQIGGGSFRKEVRGYQALLATCFGSADNNCSYHICYEFHDPPCDAKWMYYVIQGIRIKNENIFSGWVQVDERNPQGFEVSFPFLRIFLETLAGKHPF